MNVSIGASIFFIFAWLVLASAMYFLHKNDKKMNAFACLAVIIIGSMCFHTLVAGIIQLVHIPINIISLGIIDLILGCLVWYKIRKEKKLQKYYINISDILVLVGLMVVTLAIVKQRYGWDFNLHYATIDPAVHLQGAMDVIRDQRISCMYYAMLNNAVLMEVLAPLTIASNYYKLFMISDVIQFVMSGVIFYAIVIRYADDRFKKIAAFIMTFLYVGAYPLNNMIYGFNYLGMGVTVGGFIVIVTDMYLHETINKRLNIFLMMIGCMGIFESYVLFMPLTFVAVFTAVNYKQFTEKKLISLNTVVVNLAIFLLPCILGLYYTYFGIFGGNATVGGAIANEGAIYRNLYSNFITMLPLALYGYYQLIKQRKSEFILHYLTLYSLFTFVLFILVEKGKVSTYYYYKNYYLLWLLVFVMACYGIYHAEKNVRSIIVCYAVVWLGLFGIWFTRIEDKIQSKNMYIDENIKSVAYHDIYEFNYQYMYVVPGYALDKMDLYQYVANEIIGKGLSDEVPGALYWEDNFWYEAVIDQRIKGFDYWNNSEELFLENLPEQDYVLVAYDSQIYYDNVDYFNSLERVYTNNAGFVAKVK